MGQRQGWGRTGAGMEPDRIHKGAVSVAVAHAKIKPYSVQSTFMNPHILVPENTGADPSRPAVLAVAYPGIKEQRLPYLENASGGQNFPVGCSE